MSYAGKSHAHRDEKNDYSRLDKKSDIEKEIEDSEDDYLEEDFIDNANQISVSEYKRGVADSGI